MRSCPGLVLAAVQRHPGTMYIALQPVPEQLEGIAAKARSAMDAEVRQALSNAVSEILVAAKAYDSSFPSEYIFRATSTMDEEQSFGAEVQELADRYAIVFAAGDEGEAEEENEEARSP